jgi:ribose 5-phosphate isomerase A
VTQDEQKKAAAEYAVKVVENDMRVGLGSGTTANHFIKAAAEKVKREKLNTVFVASSNASETLGKSLGLNVKSLDEVPMLDFTVDGADEIDPQFRMIKGGGGAQLREKIVASSSRFVVCIADHSKLVQQLGAFPLPIEVSRFGVNATTWKLERTLAKLGYTDVQMRLRAKQDGAPYVTDSGNPIIDLKLGKITDAERLDAELHAIPGVTETGLFIGICGVLMLGTDNGVEEITRP